MPLLLKLSWRNLGRNFRRTIITILAVTFATLFSVAMRGVQLGMYDESINFALRLFPGYIQLQAPTFHATPSLHHSFVVGEEVRRQLDQVHEISAYAPRVVTEGLACLRGTSLGTTLWGIDPRRELSVSTIASRLDAGTFLENDSSGDIVVGYHLLQNLGARIGDEIVILSQGYDGTLGNGKFKIVGTLKTGSGAFDQGSIFMGLSTLQKLVAMDRRIQVVALALRSTDDVVPVMRRLTLGLDTSKVMPRSWQELLPELYQSIQLDNISGLIFLAILILVVGFGILNTILMSVTERFREFGVLLSLGISPRTLAIVVGLEAGMIMVIGLLVGNTLGFAVNAYLISHPIELGGAYGALTQQYGFVPRVTSSLRLAGFLDTSIALIAASLVSAAYPLYRTVTLEPMKGMRYT